MIPGWIDGRDQTARVSLQIRGTRAAAKLTFEIDTGFYGAILLPTAWADRLTETYETEPNGITLADGTVREVRVCKAWASADTDDERKSEMEIEVFALVPQEPKPADPPRHEPFDLPATNNEQSGKVHGLLGRAFLKESRLTIDWIKNTVRIEGP